MAAENMPTGIVEHYHQQLEVRYQGWLRIINREFGYLQATADKAGRETEVELTVPPNVLVERQAMADSLSPIDVSEKGAVFQILDRQGLAVRWGDRFHNEAKKAATEIDLVKGLRPSQPFLEESEPIAAVDGYRKSLLALSQKQRHTDSPEFTFAEWAVEAESCYDETIVEATMSILGKEQPVNEFDRFRVFIILAATLARLQEPAAFSYVVGAVDSAQRLNDPAEKVRSNIMLERAMIYAWQTNVYNSMGIIGQGRSMTVDLAPLPVKV